MADRFAPSTRRTQASRIKTLKTLVADSGVSFLPVTAEAMYMVAAALKAGGYRTGRAYLGLWETFHREAGFPWTEDLAQAKAWSRKSLERGMGPPRAAPTIDFATWAATAPANDDTDCVIIGCLWMLRGAELAGILVEQARTGPGAQVATLHLGAHKTNPEGALCERALRCTCGRGAPTHQGGPGQAMGDALCPTHALWRVIQRRRQAQTAAASDAKAVMFGTESGRARTSNEMRAHLRATLRCHRVTEHSLRRMGAQFYARHGVSVALIQHIGRWGSNAVERYVGEALAARASWAPVAAARGLDANTLLGGRGSARCLDLDVLSNVVREIVRSEPTRRAEPEAPRTSDFVIAARSGICHMVKSGGCGLPLGDWETVCGWRFGLRPHSPGTAAELSCTRCSAIAHGNP